jgi:hypothetical protein
VRRLTLVLVFAAVAGASVAAVAVAKVKPTFGSYLGSFTKGESKGMTIRPLVGQSAANGKSAALSRAAASAVGRSRGSSRASSRPRPR